MGFVALRMIVRRMRNACVSMSDSNENLEITSSKKIATSKEKKNELMTENCAPQKPTGCPPFGFKNPLFSLRSSKSDKKKVHAIKINMIAAAEVKDAQEEEHSHLYALKGMFHGFVEEIEKKYCLPQGESCMMQHDKCCHGLMCNSGECMAGNDELKL
ncbi:hypothetical protein H4I96_01387 [Botrytis cinerea]